MQQPPSKCLAGLGAHIVNEEGGPAPCEIRASGCPDRKAVMADELEGKSSDHLSATAQYGAFHCVCGRSTTPPCFHPVGVSYGCPWWTTPMVKVQQRRSQDPVVVDRSHRLCSHRDDRTPPGSAISESSVRQPGIARVAAGSDFGRQGRPLKNVVADAFQPCEELEVGWQRLSGIARCDRRRTFFARSLSLQGAPLVGRGSHTPQPYDALVTVPELAVGSKAAQLVRLVQHLSEVENALCPARNVDPVQVGVVSPVQGLPLRGAGA